ncbi:hypothetical protein SAMN04488527_1101 [Aliiroseovarius crassostreae]|nr:hypothetical protein SAMN04488527_1101 [Aliiroseovarius crassostreae]
MTLDVRGSLKNTKLSKNPYVVFEELLSNAIDSFLIRRDADTAVSISKSHSPSNSGLLIFWETRLTSK